MESNNKLDELDQVVSKNIQQIVLAIYQYPELLSYMFYDGIKIAGGITYEAAEKTEPGYFRALYLTFLEELQKLAAYPTRPMTEEKIKNIHLRSIQNVQLTNYSTCNNVIQSDDIINQYSENMVYWIPYESFNNKDIAIKAIQSRTHSQFYGRIYYAGISDLYGL